MRPIDSEELSKKVERDFLDVDQATCDADPQWASGYNAGLRWVLGYTNKAETITQPPNAPLTLEELREMDGEPVYLDFGEGCGEWVLVQKDEKDVSLMHKNGIPASFGWAVECGGKLYSRKPEEGTA